MDTPAPQSETPSPPPRRHSKALLALLAAAALVIAALSGALVLALTTGDESPSAGAPSPSTSASSGRVTTVTVRGTITMERYDDPDSDYRTANWKRTDGAGVPACEGVGGYDDMVAGTTVTVYDSAGTVIAVGALQEGVPVGSQCEWTFAIHQAPDLPFYKVEVSHRGQVAVQRADVGAVSLNLG